MGLEQDWTGISDLPDDWQKMSDQGLSSLGKIWQEQKSRLDKSKDYQEFLARMRRRIAIETGVIERLYNIDRGITQLLIEQGIDEALIPHGTTDRPPDEVVAMIRDHQQALEGLFIFVKGERELSTSYIKELHQTLTQHQTTTRAKDQFGNISDVPLLRGEWKKLPNNPTREDGTVYHYCPPLQVDLQMEQFIQWHLEHQKSGVTPEVEAAWLHHRFAQIHPFQDGNGRVARCLASLIFIRAGWFPLVVTRDERSSYIEALESADNHDLKPLVELFARSQQSAFLKALSISEQVLSEKAGFAGILDYAVEKLKEQPIPSKVRGYGQLLFDIAVKRFEEARDQIATALKDVANTKVWVESAPNDDQEKSRRFSNTVIYAAEKLDYPANLSNYAAWVSLTIIITSNTQTQILLSFHGIGTHNNDGLLVCSAFGFRYVRNDSLLTQRSIGTIDIELYELANHQPLSQSPFQFSYLDDKENLIKRFKEWLENVVVTGAAYWSKGL